MQNSYFWLLLINLELLASIGCSDGLIPLIYSTRSSAECSLNGFLQDQHLMNASRQVLQQMGSPGCNPPRNRSCQKILHCYQSAILDYYQIQPGFYNSSLVMHCDMEGTHCMNITGWTRVVYVNMTQPNALIAWHYKLFLLPGLVSVEEKAVDVRVHCFPQLVLIILLSSACAGSW